MAKKALVAERLKLWFNRFLHFLAWIFVRTIYSFQIEGQQHFVQKEGTLLISNHISFIDFLVLSCLAPRGKVIYFVIDYDLYRIPIVNLILRGADTIPIATKKHLHIRERAFELIDEKLQNGDYVAFFPEGVVTYDGEMNQFKWGLDRIRLANHRVLIQPITITGLIGGFFSRVNGLFKLTKLPGEFRRKVKITISPPVPAFRWNLEHFELKIRLMLNETSDKTFVQLKGVLPNLEHYSDYKLPKIRVNKRLASQEELKGIFCIKDKDLDNPHKHPFNLKNISHAGIGFQTNICLKKGQIIEVFFNGVEQSVFACVRWCSPTKSQGYNAGLKIHESFDDDFNKFA